MSTEKKVAGEFEGSNGGAFACTEHLEMQMHFMRCVRLCWKQKSHVTPKGALSLEAFGPE